MTYYEQHREKIKARARAYYAEHREEYSVRRKAARLADPDKFKAIEKARYEARRSWREAYHLKNRDRINGYGRKNATGWTAERYEEYLSAQEGCCAICDADEGRRLCADHKGAEQRGLLCRRCNLGLGYFRDNPELLRLAAEYLESYSTKATTRRIASADDAA